MYSQYRLYPSISQPSTFPCERREHGQILNRYSKHPLPIESGHYEHRSNGEVGGVPVSYSNGSLIDFDIDTSDFMNIKSPFPWDDNQLAYCHTDPNHSVRYSFPSTYYSKTSLLHETNELLGGSRQSRESILIPDFPQDLADHHIKAREARPANL